MKRIHALAAIAALGLLGADRVQQEPPSIREALAKYARPAAVPYPEQNGHTKAREELGRTLFFDPRLSGSNFIACASCHNPGFSWSDPLPKAIGHGMNELGRRTPSVLNLAWARPLLLGRPRREPRGAGDGADHGARRDEPERRGAGGRAAAPSPATQPLFAAAYPGEGITTDTISKALATFERGVVSGEAPFDRWVAGDERAVSAAAKRGFQLFEGKARLRDLPQRLALHGRQLLRHRRGRRRPRPRRAGRGHRGAPVRVPHAGAAQHRAPRALRAQRLRDRRSPT